MKLFLEISFQYDYRLGFFKILFSLRKVYNKNNKNNKKSLISIAIVFNFQFF